MNARGVGVALIVLVLVACGKKKDEPAKSPPAPAPNPAPTPTPVVAAPLSAAEAEPRIEKICARVAECACEGGESCGVGSRREAPDLPATYFSCVENVHQSDCPAVCAEYRGTSGDTNCFRTAEPAMWRRRDERAFVASQPPPAVAARVKSVCEKERSCGCGTADCEKNLSVWGAAFPDSMWDCLQTAVDSCACKPEVTQACVEAERAVLTANQRASVVGDFCTKTRACNCAADTCETDWKPPTEDSPIYSFLFCARGLDCQAICGAIDDPTTPIGKCKAEAMSTGGTGAWTCFASGQYSNCRAGGGDCGSVPITGSSRGDSEESARGFAVNNCVTQMTKMQTIQNMNLRNPRQFFVNMPCQATSCSR